MKLSKKVRALVGALAMTLAIAAPALANGSASETLTVDAYVTLTGVPTSIDYGPGLGATRRASPAFALTADTNAANGLKIAITGTNLVAGPNTILASQRLTSALGMGGTATASMTGGTASWSETTPKVFVGPSQTMATSSNPGTVSFTQVKTYVDVPAGQAPGAYTGTVTFAATINP